LGLVYGSRVGFELRDAGCQVIMDNIEYYAEVRCRVCCYICTSGCNSCDVASAGTAVCQVVVDEVAECTEQRSVSYLNVLGHKTGV
jgi:hypothetical protein